ncbi:MAG: SMP-30/gluconolactonase/LRE family protein [Actinomycetota bacterium]|nr:SMP-30/gluconolactonase/LRE family protein [Actinomycetota bacterium]
MSKPTIRPRRWTPPPAAPGPQLPPGLPPMRVVDVPGYGTEDVLVDDRGRVLTGTEDGRILRLGDDGVETVAMTGGRPLGLEHAPDGSLVVCDARRGLLRVDPGTETVEVLVDEVAGARMRFCNNAAVAADGTIYFTDSSRHFGIDDWKADLLEHGSTGRLLRRSPQGEIDVLLHGQAFANGVALAADESFVAIAETGAYALQRLWLTGARAGEHEPFVESLPGFPDNISTGSDGLIWVSLASPRDPVLDFLLPRPPLLRRIVWALPERLQPRPARTVRVQAYDATGTLVHDLNGEHDDFHMVTGVREHEGTVWVGSLHEAKVAAIGPLPPGP